ncbi:haloacid dehalogenase [Spirochaetia bacterium]|nr:haloacid dehalogenase [Spirochaetia bacterium]
MIRAIVFDYGQVLSKAPKKEALTELARLSQLAEKELDVRMWKFRSEYDRGTWTGEHYFKVVLEDAELTPAAGLLAELVRIDLESWGALEPGAEALFREVRLSALRLGILSNMPKEFLDYARKTIPLFALPDVGIFSCDTHTVKPEPAIYQTLLTALDCSAHEVVFFDDRRQNVEAALALGIKAWHWTGDIAAARSFLRGLGLQF